jgi:hypothetical protein
MKGYLQATGPISLEEAERIKQHWEDCMKTGKIAVLSEGIKFVSLEERNNNNVIIRCGHCGQWAAVKTACKHCGASIIE